jgi:tRNA A37 threonylcarbamoyladenosine synthetase subunit TsaC/SUA5/YrdC
MLNTSGIYILKNKKLRNELTNYYTLIETFQQFIREMNSDSQQLIKNENLNAHHFLVKEHDKPWFANKKIDTTWIGDFNSPTMLALHKFYMHAQGALNISRQKMLKTIIEKSNLLLVDLEKELKSKNYKE